MSFRLGSDMTGYRYNAADMTFAYNIDDYTEYCYAFEWSTVGPKVLANAETFVDECRYGLFGFLMGPQTADCRSRRYIPT